MVGDLQIAQPVPLIWSIGHFLHHRHLAPYIDGYGYGVDASDGIREGGRGR